jgi:hypothetical protein
MDPALQANLEQLDKLNAYLDQLVWAEGKLEEPLKIETSVWQEEFRQDVSVSW